MPLPEIDTTITLKIDGLTYSGDAVANYEGHTATVQRGVPGDTVKARVVGIHDDVIRTEITEVIAPSPDRVNPKCKGFHAGCGGCQWLQVDYQAQLRWKKRVVESLLARSPSLRTVTVHDVAGMNSPFHYRNKMVVRVRGRQDDLRVGFHTPRTKWVIGVFSDPEGTCEIQNDLNNQIGRGLFTSLSKQRRPLKSATVRSSETGEVNLDLDKKLASFISQDLEGIGTQSKEVHYTVLGRRFRVTSPSFFQANTRQTAVLVQTVLNMLDGMDLRIVVDVYCGVGLFALFLAERARQVYGIEESHTAIDDALHNAQAHGISNISLIREKAEAALPSLTVESATIDLIMVDPPRSGCHEEVLRTIAEARPRQFVYVSCNVDTLVRDLALMGEMGYRAVEIRPVDMFPHTYHIECVARCELSPDA